MRDWDFLVARAQANGMIVSVVDGQLSAKVPDMGGDAGLSLLLGDTVFELDAEIDARRQFQSATARGWDHSAQEVVEQEASAPAANPQGNLPESELAAALGVEDFQLRHAGRLDSQELQAWADAQLINGGLAKILGRAQIPGHADVSVGQLVELSGIGDRLQWQGTGRRRPARSQWRHLADGGSVWREA